MTTTQPFVCSICEETSTRICVKCTKDTCANHLCEKCRACSDCCDCEIRLDDDLTGIQARKTASSKKIWQIRRSRRRIRILCPIRTIPIRSRNRFPECPS